MITFQSIFLLTAIICLQSLGMKKQVSFDEQRKDFDQFYFARRKDLKQIKEYIKIIPVDERETIVNKQEELTGNTILHYSVILGDIDTIEYLVTIKGLNPFIQNESEHSAYKLACEAAKGIKGKDKNAVKQMAIKTILDSYIKHGLLLHSESAPTIIVHK